MRLLVVEDERELAESLPRGLTAEGYTVDVAHDGNIGLERALSEGYQAIIVDLMLPKMNGYQVCARLRESRVSTPVLVLTAKDGEYDEAEALDTGADDYLTKPFSYDPASNAADVPRTAFGTRWEAWVRATGREFLLFGQFR